MTLGIVMGGEEKRGMPNHIKNVHPLNAYIVEFNWAESPTSSSTGFTLGALSRKVAACKVAPTSAEPYIYHQVALGRPYRPRAYHPRIPRINPRLDEVDPTGQLYTDILWYEFLCTHLTEEPIKNGRHGLSRGGATLTRYPTSCT